MTTRTWSVFLIVGILTGCSQSVATTQTPENSDAYARNSALFDQAEAISKRNEALMARAEQQATRAAAEADRIDALLTKWEAQQRRADAILSRLESRKP